MSATSPANAGAAPAERGASRDGAALRVARRRRRLIGVLVGSGFRAAPGMMTAAVVLGVIGAAASVSYPIGYRLMVDAAIQRDGGRVAAGAAVVAGLFCLSWVVGIVNAGQASILVDRINLHLGVRFASLLNAAPGLEHFERPDYLRAIDQVRDNRRGLAAASRQWVAALNTAIRVVVILVLLATVYPPLLVVPLVGLVPALADRHAAKLRQRSDDELAEDRRLLGDLFGLATNAETAKELRTSGVTEALAARHERLGEQIRVRSVHAALRSSLWEAAGWLAYAAGLVAAIVLLVLRAAHGQATVGQVLMAVSLIRQAQAQVSSATDTAGNLGSALMTATRLLWLEDYVAGAGTPAPIRAGESPTSESELASSRDKHSWGYLPARRARGRAGDSPPSPGGWGGAPAVRNAVPVPEALGVGIRFEGVSFAYPGADEPVLHEVDVLLPAGATVAVVGENGAGKTTLVKLLTGMYRPTAGRVLVDGIDLADMDLAAWRERTTAAFQDFLFLQMAGQHVIGLGDLPNRDDEDAAWAATDRAGAREVVESFPDGMGTLLGRFFSGGRELSGGQWQRLALSRAMMRPEPLLTVLDEPTASLDAPTEAALFTRYAEAARRSDGAVGAVTLLVSHRFSTVRMADLIVVVDDGRIVESGDHDTLLASGGAYAQLFALQARAYLSSE